MVFKLVGVSACVQGLALLHWASDRGLLEMTAMLLDHGADVNLQVKKSDMGFFQNFLEFQNFEGWQGHFLEPSKSK